MNKKILTFSIFAVFILTSISLVSADNLNIIKPVLEKDESPLFRIRTEQAIGEKIQELKTKFIGERLFFLPFQWVLFRDGLSVRQQLNNKGSATTDYTVCENSCKLSCGIDCTSGCILEQER